MDDLPSVGTFSPAWVDFFIVFGVVALVALLTFIWAIVFHSNGPRRHKKKHRHRRKHRSLNPTLAQSGGLPPVREEEKSSGQAPPTTPP
jgi:hypothetical protein